MLNIKELNKEEILSIIKKAIEIKQNKKHIINNKSIANIFIEPSTRTKISFEKAQRDLNMDVYNLEFESSALKKSEDLVDTIYTLKQYGINNFVIRSSQEGYWEQLKDIEDINIINAGDGTKNHPTQALLDAMTIYEQFNTLDNLKILISGDVKNSRVYHSFKDLIEKFDSKLFLSAPNEFQTNDLNYVDFNNSLSEMDVIMMLRIQHERHNFKFNINEYNNKYGINKNNIQKLKPNTILMHPGPVNRGVEIAKDISYKEPKNKILKQVENGFFIRKAILSNI